MNMYLSTSDLEKIRFSLEAIYGETDELYLILKKVDSIRIKGDD